MDATNYTKIDADHTELGLLLIKSDTHSYHPTGDDHALYGYPGGDALPSLPIGSRFANRISVQKLVSEDEKEKASLVPHGAKAKKILRYEEQSRDKDKDKGKKRDGSGDGDGGGSGSGWSVVATDGGYEAGH